MIFPCKDCTDRTLGCHSSCAKYLSTKADYDKKRAEVKRQADADSFVTSSILKRVGWHKKGFIARNFINNYD